MAEDLGASETRRLARPGPEVVDRKELAKESAVGQNKMK